MRAGFVARLAYREGRSALGRVGAYLASIALGVAALVAIRSFRDDVARSVREEATVLMGADARLASFRAFPDPLDRLLDSLAAAGVPLARVQTSLSMVVAPGSGAVRLVQVQAGEGGYPFYGAVRTNPPGLWGRHLEEPAALADPPLLAQMGVRPGDTLRLGEGRVVLLGTVEDFPTDLGFQTALGPRLFVSLETFREARAAGLGGWARHQVFFELPDRAAREALRDRYRPLLRQGRVSYTLAEEQADELADGVRFLGRFLGLLGLGALFLGGVGVASAVHGYMRGRRSSVAVLRCLGADPWSLLGAYLLQAAGLGVAGAAVGVGLGMGIQHLLPILLREVSPLPVIVRASPEAALWGLGIGAGVASLFSLIPLLEVRHVPPLQALRQDFEGASPRFDPLRVTAYSALGAALLFLCVREAPAPPVGLAFLVGLTAVGLTLTVVGWGLTRLVRRFFPSWAPYPVRQGVSNLFRPRNQTLAVVLALGFGVFVVGTVLQVQGTLLRSLDVSFAEGRPQVLLFDVRQDQVKEIESLLPADEGVKAETVPIVPARIRAVNGRAVAQIRGDTAGPNRPSGWALRREYRSTFRSHLTGGETLVAGRWWDGTPGIEDTSTVEAGQLARISLEAEAAEDLGVSLGDTITWAVSGTEVPSVVTSLRRVTWSRPEPNFFVVFEPGVLDEIPHTLVMLLRIPDPAARGLFQRTVVEAFPNVSLLEVARIQESVEGILRRVRQAVAFLGFFAAAAGTLVLMGALSVSRLQRMRELALLKTLGARRRQILGVLWAEYVTLGTLSAAAGLALAWGASSLLATRLFRMEFSPPWGTLILLWAAVGTLTVVVGLVGSLNLLRRPPLPVLREALE